MKMKIRSAVGMNVTMRTNSTMPLHSMRILMTAFLACNKFTTSHRQVNQVVRVIHGIQIRSTAPHQFPFRLTKVARERLPWVNLLRLHLAGSHWRIGKTGGTCCHTTLCWLHDTHVDQDIRSVNLTPTFHRCHIDFSFTQNGVSTIPIFHWNPFSNFWKWKRGAWVSEIALNVLFQVFWQFCSSFIHY